MRSLILVVLVAACGGGQSIGPNACDNTQPDPVCCTQDTECSGDFTEFCLAPGAFAGCGVCNSEPSECSGDPDCKSQGATMICQPRTCACEGETACVAGCTADGECKEAQVCDLATNRCKAQACQLTTECPTDFVCNAGFCLRLDCTSNNDCDAFCVKGFCFQSAGECVPTPV